MTRENDRLRREADAMEEHLRLQLRQQQLRRRRRGGSPVSFGPTILVEEAEEEEEAGKEATEVSSLRRWVREFLFSFGCESETKKKCV